MSLPYAVNPKSMGFWTFQRSVWWRAVKDARRTAIPHTIWGTLRLGVVIVLTTIAMLIANQLLHIVDRGLMSADNIKDNFITLVVFVPIALAVLFFGLLVIEGLFIVPYKMWKEAHEAPKPAAAPTGTFPDWQIHTLFSYLRPDLPLKPEKAWMKTLKDVEDRFSTGQLEVWGRRHLATGSSANASLERIDRDYWKDADLIAWAADSEWASGVHTRRRSLKTEWEYRDLQVNRSQAIAIWPAPLAAPRPIERDKKLEEAIAYFMFHEWGHNTWKETGDNVPMLDAALKWFHQLAVDDAMQVWGRRERNHGVYEKISATYWKAHHVDMLDLLGDESPKTTNIQSHLQLDTYFDPMVSAVETESALNTSIGTVGCIRRSEPKQERVMPKSLKYARKGKNLESLIKEHEKDDPGDLDKLEKAIHHLRMVRGYGQ